MNTEQPLVLFSTDLDDTDAENKRRQRTACKALKARKIPHGHCRGCYEGQSESSFIVPDTPEALAIVRRLAAWSDQQSILRVDANRQAILERPDGCVLAALGAFREVPRESTENLAGFTEFQGRYFAAEG